MVAHTQVQIDIRLSVYVATYRYKCVLEGNTVQKQRDWTTRSSSVSSSPRIEKFTTLKPAKCLGRHRIAPCCVDRGEARGHAFLRTRLYTCKIAYADVHMAAYAFLCWLGPVQFEAGHWCKRSRERERDRGSCGVTCYSDAQTQQSAREKERNERKTERCTCFGDNKN